MKTPSGVPCAKAWALALALLVSTAPALAIDDRADTDPNEPVSPEKPVAWKLMAGQYRETGERDAFDLNLRGNTDRHTFWIGHYQRGSDLEQTRAGFERQQPFALGRLILSAQAASKGFLGGSVTWEASAAEDDGVFGLLGFGRTNRRPYVNLNFDPNDSVLVGGGWRIDAASQLTLFQIWDDRLGTDQRVTHLVFRRTLEGNSRLTFDVFHRRGREAAGMPMRKGDGISLTYDFDRWFARIARDPGANFTEADMTRIAVGMRF